MSEVDTVERDRPATQELHGFSRERLHELMRAMLLYRRFEEKIEEAYAIGKIGGFCHVHIGQEATAAGTILPLRREDYVISAYRAHTQAIAKGVEPRAVMAELYGKATGCCGGLGGSMHLFNKAVGFMGGHGIVGAQAALAVGIAFGIKYRDEDNVVVCFLGDAAVNQGAFHEAMNMAAIWNLPVIYAVENNGYGMGTEFTRVSTTEMARKSASHGVPATVVNGQDVLETYRTFEELVERTRTGGGPQFVDVRTYRFRGHSMSDPVSGTYRSKQEVDRKVDCDDPITLLKDQLFEADLMSQDELEALDAEVMVEVDEVEAFAESSPEPEESAIYDFVYSQKNEHGRLFMDGHDRGQANG